MRATVVKVGIQERLNCLLGTTDPDPSNGNSTDLTAWSIQSSMNKNVQRVVKALVGSSPAGKVMTGLQISQGTMANTILINGGIGFTVAGNIIVINPTSIIKSLGSSLSVGQVFPIYLMYGQQPLSDSANVIDKHMSNIMGTSVTPLNIISDDICSNTNNPDIIANQIAITTQDLSINDGLYLGQVTITATTPDVIMTIAPALYNSSTTGNNHSYIGSFNAISSISPNALYSFDGVVDNLFVPVITPGSSLVSFNVLRRYGSIPDSIPVDRPSDMTTNIQIWGLQKDGAGATQLYDGYTLHDTANQNHVDYFNANNLIIPDSVYGLTIKTSTTGWNSSWTPDYYGSGTVTMLINNLS